MLASEGANRDVVGQSAISMLVTINMSYHILHSSWLSDKWQLISLQRRSTAGLGTNLQPGRPDGAINPTGTILGCTSPNLFASEANRTLSLAVPRPRESSSKTFHQQFR